MLASVANDASVVGLPGAAVAFRLDPENAGASGVPKVGTGLEFAG